MRLYPDYQVGETSESVPGARNTALYEIGKVLVFSSLSAMSGTYSVGFFVYVCFESMCYPRSISSQPRLGQ